MIYRPYSLFSLFLLILFLQVDIVHAKKEVVVPLVPVNEISGSVNCNTVHVIDTRKNKANISHNGAGRKKLVTKDSLSVELRQFAQTMIQNADSFGEYELLILLHDLELTSLIPAVSMVNSVHIQMSSYVGKDGRYQPVLALDSLYEMPAQKLNALIDTALLFISDFIEEAATTDIAKSENTLTLSQILSIEEEAKQYILPYTQPPKKGVYYTFEQFKNNTPADTAVYFSRRSHDGRYYYKFFLNSLKGKDRKDLADTTVFAVSDGKIWCKRAYTTDFEEMKLMDGDFYYNEVLYGLSLQDHSAVAYSVGANFGAIGGAIGGAVAQGLNNREVNKPRKYDAAIFRMKLDPVTGNGKKQKRLL